MIKLGNHTANRGTLFAWLLDSHKDGASTFLWKVGNHIPEDSNSSQSLPSEPETSRRFQYILLIHVFSFILNSLKFTLWNASPTVPAVGLLPQSGTRCGLSSGTSNQGWMGSDGLEFGESEDGRMYDVLRKTSIGSSMTDMSPYWIQVGYHNSRT